MLDWLAAARGAGIDALVRVGVAGPASVRSLLRFAARCGVGASAKMLTKYGTLVTRLLSTATPDVLLDELTGGLRLDVHGAVKIHVYPFGGLAATVRWAAGYSADAPPAVLKSQ